MTHPRPTPTRSLPDRANFGQLRKQAKELLRSYKTGEPDAIAEVERFEANPDPNSFALADAQRVLARAYGQSSWTRLKEHVDGVNVDAFVQAVRAGDVVTVRKLAEARGELVNTTGGESGEKLALHFAVLNRDLEMTCVLMELGADARRGFWPYRDATTAFALASDRDYDEIVAVIQQEEHRRRKRQSAPGTTVSSKTEEVAKAILEDRCDVAMRILEGDMSLVGASGRYGTTPLHVAAWKHNPEMVVWLLERQAAVDAVNPFHDRMLEYAHIAALGRTPLDYAATVAGWAASKKHYEWIEGDDRFPNLENTHVDPARFDETVDVLRSHGAELTPRAAVALGDRRAVLQMHREGRLNTNIHVGRGGLLAIAARVNHIDMVTLLLELGFDPDEPAAPPEDGLISRGFPLWYAAMCGHHDIAELLLAHGADVNAIVFASGDSLCRAYATRDKKMQSLLLTNGARLTVENLGGDDARETARAILDGKIASQSLNVDDPSPTQLAEQLLWAHADTDPEIVRMCLPRMERELDDPWWASALMGSRQPESLKLILEHGVDPDVCGEERPTPLQHLASDYVNATGHVPDGLRVTFAEILLDAGASLTRRDALLQSTALGWACRWGRVALVKLYLERGADPVEADAERWATPLAWATKGEHQEIIKLFGERTQT